MKKRSLVIMSIVLCVLMQSCISQNNLPEQTDVPFNVGEVVTVEPSNEIPFYWNYYIPENVLKNKEETCSILLNGAYGQLGRSIEDGQDFTIKHMNEHINYIKNTSYILLAPAIPRRNENFEGNPWVMHFPNYIFNKISGKFFRPDLEINEMIEKLKYKLQENNVIVNQKVFVFGYSIGGHFANRYTILNPHKVKAYAAGGLSGELTIPIEEIDGKKLLWPLGISNLEKLTKQPYNSEAYKDIPQYIFWGELDKYPYHLKEKYEHDNKISYYGHWIEKWGEDSPTALLNQSEYVKKIGVNIEYHEYENIGHKFTSEMFIDMLEFFDEKQ